MGFVFSEQCIMIYSIENRNLKFRMTHFAWNDHSKNETEKRPEIHFKSSKRMTGAFRTGRLLN